MILLFIILVRICSYEVYNELVIGMLYISKGIFKNVKGIFKNI